MMMPPMLLPCNKRRRRRKVDYFNCNFVDVDDDVDDYISQLPDDILASVLSRLTMKEAARTSILSSRWRYLWKYCFTGNLNFDNPLPLAFLRAEIHPAPEMREERIKFIRWVNRILGSLQCGGGQYIKGLRICFDVKHHPAGDDIIDNWVNFAVQKKVQNFELDFTEVEFPRASSQYTFASHLLTSYSSFQSLKSLRLANVGVTGDVLQHLLLSHCPSLELLSVKWSRSLTSLKLVDPSLKLKHLELYVDALKDLEIRLPSLVSFTCQRSRVTVSLGDIPNLSNLSLGYHFSDYLLDNICQLNGSLLRLHALTLSPIVPEIPGEVPNSFTKLSNLKYLEVGLETSAPFCLLNVAFLLKLCPSLCKLKLKKVCLGPMYKAVPAVKNHPNFSFKKLSVTELELVGFKGQDGAELITYLVESAELLQKITIDSCPEDYKGTPKETLWRQSEDCKFQTQLVCELIGKFPTVQYVIL